MANEFVIKHGFHSKDDSQITGSLDVSGTLTAGGSVVGAGGPFTQIGSTSTYQAQDSKALQITGSLIVTGSFIPLGSATDDTNVLIGKDPATNITSTSANNVVIGNEAGGGGGTFDNADGNVLLGYQAGNGVDGGDYNICIGQQAGYLMDGNSSIIAMGYQAIRNIGQNYAIGIGYAAGRFQTNGPHVLLGANAGMGVSGQSAGRYNTCIGDSSGYVLEDGYWNVVMGGEDAGYKLKDGYHNLIIGGEDTAYHLTDGSGNIILGSKAGSSIVTGDDNIIIGHSASFTSDVSNQLFIGSASFATISASLATGETIVRSQRPFQTIGTNPFTASADNVGNYFRMGGNVTCSIIANVTASCPIGAEFDFFQTSSAGNVLFEAEPQVTINSKNDNLNLAGQFSSATIKKVGTDEWDLMGDLT